MLELTEEVEVSDKIKSICLPENDGENDYGYVNMAAYAEDPTDPHGMSSMLELSYAYIWNQYSYIYPGRFYFFPNARICRVSVLNILLNKKVDFLFVNQFPE